ncbi:MAG: hypothetical protein KA267_07190 [Gemmatimonadales bacterium]|nr:hypothetical protein [Gemmatimonadales bacterium]MBP6570186.1 hypothetical protein [Gemmatimonadales bacterium]MBP9897516.1 hypothetical protein [Gemmatimonadales bacterium]
MALRTVELALDDLLASGIVERVVGGRERLVQVRSAHRLTPSILAVLRAGADHWPALRSELRAAATTPNDPTLLAVAVVGRVATRSERIGDPLDLLLLTADDATAARWVERFASLGDGVAARFGVTLRPIGYGLDAAREMWAARTSAAEQTVRQAERVHGAELLVLLSGG